MRKNKLLKFLLTSFLGISSIGAISTITSSCGSKKQDDGSDDEVNFETKCFWITPYRDNDITFKFWQYASANNSPNLEFALVDKNELETIDNLQDTEWKSVDMDVQYTVKTNQIMALRGDNPNGWLQFTGKPDNPSYTQTGNISISGDTTIGGSLVGLLDNGGKNQIDDIPALCFLSLFRAIEDDVSSTASEICEIKNNLFWSINNENCNLGNLCFQNMFAYNDKLTKVNLDAIFPTLAQPHTEAYAYVFQYSNIQKFYMNVYGEPCNSLYKHLFHGCSTINDITLDFVDGFNTTHVYDGSNECYRTYRYAFSYWNSDINANGTIKFITHLQEPSLVKEDILRTTFNLNSNWTIEIA